jgi:hypothetical protein
MNKQLIYLLAIAVILVIVVGIFLLSRKEKFSLSPVSFQIFQKADPQQGIVYNYINLPIGQKTYTVMLDTGSSNLVINGFDTSSATPLTNNEYDSYTIYGGNVGTAQDCINAFQTGGKLAGECVVQKYYNTNQLDNISNQTTTVSTAIYGAIPSIMGLAMPGLLKQGSPEFKTHASTSGQPIDISPLVNWNTGSIENFTIDFKNKLITFNDTDQNFSFFPRVKFYGYHTDFYALECQTQEIGKVNIVFDTGLYDCLVPANVNSLIKNGKGTMTITSPFQAHIDSSLSTYQTMPQNLNFVIMGYTHMQFLEKIYFDANQIGISKPLSFS